MLTKRTKQSREELNKENNTLGNTLKVPQERLQEMQETLDAIINGAVDGIVRHTPKGNQIFILKGSEEPYRNLIEEMEEGAVLLSSAGTILYCNGGFAKLVDAPLDSIMSKNIACWVSESSSNTLADLLLNVKGRVGKRKFDVTFQTAGKRLIPTQVSLTKISMSTVNATALIITDLTKHMEEEVKRYTANLEREITERKKAEEELKRSEEHARQSAEELQKLMDIIPAAVFLSRDPECKVIVGNQTANAFFEAVGEENVSAGTASAGSQNTTRRFFRSGKELYPPHLQYPSQMEWFSVGIY